MLHEQLDSLPSFWWGLCYSFFFVLLVLFCSVSLDCPNWIEPLVFSNVYLKITTIEDGKIFVFLFF